MEAIEDGLSREERYMNLLIKIGEYNANCKNVIEGLRMLGKDVKAYSKEIKEFTSELDRFGKAYQTLLQSKK